MPRIERQQLVETATIANTATTSDAVIAQGCRHFGAVLPAEFDGTTLEFLVSADGVTYQTLYNSDGVTKTAMTGLAASRSYDLPAALAAWPAFKLVAGAQTGATVITIVKKG